MGVILTDKIIEVILSRVNQHKIAAVKIKSLRSKLLTAQRGLSMTGQIGTFSIKPPTA